MKVDFLVAGFQKCGTSALHSFLTSHPKVIGSKPKELDFFNYNENYRRGVKYYHSFFDKKMFSKVRNIYYLESSPSYINDKDISKTAQRIKQYNPKIKIIVLVRNPIDRAFSAWNMYKKRYEKGDYNWWFDWVKTRDGVYPEAIRRTMEEYKDFGIFVQKELEAIKFNNNIECPVIKQGLYYNGISAFKNVFRENLMVIKNEELNSCTGDTLEQLSKFLKLESYDWGGFDGEKVFKGDYDSNLSEDIKKQLENFYFESNSNLNALTGIKYL